MVERWLVSGSVGCILRRKLRTWRQEPPARWAGHLEAVHSVSLTSEPQNELCCGNGLGIRIAATHLWTRDQH
jgi:hypothetical protein